MTNALITIDETAREKIISMLDQEHKGESALRIRITAVMDSLSLDALAYPTVRQKPTLIGEVQTGSTCQLAT